MTGSPRTPTVVLNVERRELQAEASFVLEEIKPLKQSVIDCVFALAAVLVADCQFSRRHFAGLWLYPRTRWLMLCRVNSRPFLQRVRNLAPEKDALQFRIGPATLALVILRTRSGSASCD